MVRRCAVPNCKSNDMNTLSHRFPRNISVAAQWQESLQLFDYDLIILISKYVVCTKHFQSTDYRNTQSKFINYTAIPKLDPQNCISNNMSSNKSTSIPKLRNKNVYESMSSNIQSKEPTRNNQEVSINQSLSLSELKNQHKWRDEPVLLTPISNEIQFEHFEDINQSDQDYNVEYIDDPETLQIGLDNVGIEYIANQSCSTFTDILIDVDKSECFVEENGPEAINEKNTGEISIAAAECLEDIKSNNSVISDSNGININSCAVDLNVDCNDCESEPIYELYEPNCDGDLLIDNNAHYYEIKNTDMVDFREMSRECLIENLICAKRKISELETKLETIQLAHNTMIGSLEAFKNVLKS